MPALALPQNVELGVLRIYPSPRPKLRRKAVAAPQPAPAEDIDDGSLEERDVVFATATGDAIRGLLMAAGAEGDWTLDLAWSGGRLPCGNVKVDAAGRFSAHGVALPDLVFGSGRVVVQLRQPTRAAEGFLAISDHLELGRAIGAVAGAMMRTATGSGDDEDLVAVLEWIAMHPEEALAPWRSPPKKPPSEGDVTRLVGADDAAILTDEELRLSASLANGIARSAIERLLARLRAQLQQPPEVMHLAARSDHVEVEDLDDDANEGPQVGSPQADPVLSVFEVLWSTLRARISSDPAPALLQMADFAKYIAVRRNASIERIQMVVEDWTATAIQYLTPEMDAEVLAVARLFIVLGAALDGAVAKARRRLLHLALPGHGDPFQVDIAQMPLADRLITASCGLDAFEETLRSVVRARIAYDDLLLVRDAVQRSEVVPPLSVLEGRPEIDAIRRFIARGRTDMIRLLLNGEDYCPIHGRKLPSSLAYQLKGRGLAVAECCDRVLVNLLP